MSACSIRIAPKWRAVPACVQRASCISHRRRGLFSRNGVAAASSSWRAAINGASAAGKLWYAKAA